VYQKYRVNAPECLLLWAYAELMPLTSVATITSVELRSCAVSTPVETMNA
jgi:hypothetical protein